MTKNRKQSSSDNTDDEIKQQDFISKLPDALLLQILSLLPESDANRTRILSNRWKHLLAFLPILRLNMLEWPIEQVNKFHDSVDQTLALRGGMPIQRFFLNCAKTCDYNRVYDWLCIVVQSKVEQLELNFSADRNRVRLCWDLFKTCNTLVTLTLKGNFLLDVPEAEFLFPCLKKLDLLSVVYSGDESLVNLISGSPILEELFVERQVFFDRLQMFKVSSHSLKRLRMLFKDNILQGIWDYESAIDVPNLEYLYIEDKMSSVYSFTKMPSLVEAHIETTGSAVELLTCLSSAKTLTLTYETIKVVCSVHGIGMSRFPNLVKLALDIGWNMRCWNLLHLFLDRMPNLEHITFLDGLLHAPHSDIVSWNPPEEAPACLRFKIKEMLILNREVVTQEQFPLISYLLKHSSILERFTFNAHDMDPERSEQLLNFQRGSNICRIEFI